MKKIILSILAIAALAACSKEEPIQVAERAAISFENSFVDNSTRASAYTTDNLGSFQVFGSMTGTSGNPVAIFDNVTVTKGKTDGIGNTWQYDTDKVQYWIDGASYKFAAVVDGTVTAKDANFCPATITYDASTQNDLLYAVNNFGTYNEDTSEAEVAFTFAHLLSKVTYKVTNTTANNSNIKYSITGFTITNTPKNGTYTVATEKWTGTDTFATELGAVENVVNGTPVTAATSKLVIPGTYTATIEFTANIYYGTELISTVAHTGTNAISAALTLEAGHSYVLSMKVGLDNPIKFSLEENGVEEWAPNTSGDLDIN